MKLSKQTQIIIFSVPILVGLYLIYKQFSNSKKSAPTADANNPSENTNSTTNPYPLKKGSKNSNVSSLQSLLNTALTCQNQTLLVVDGNFGAKTEAALNTYFGKKSVENDGEFSLLQSKLSALCSLSKNLNRAWDLVDKQNSGGNSSMVVNSPISMYQVVKSDPFSLNFDSTWKPVTPQNVINLGVHSYSLNDFKIVAATNAGNLRIQILNGDLAGMYITTDSTDLTNIDIK
jgi:hypothetical protein